MNPNTSRLLTALLLGAGLALAGLFVSGGLERFRMADRSISVKGLAEKDVEKRHQIVWEAIRVNIEEGPFIIGISGDQAMPIVVKNYMRNILDFGVVGPWAPATPGNQVPAQWWMDK